MNEWIWMLNIKEDEYVDEDNVDEILEKAVEEIKTDIEDQDKDSIIRTHAFQMSSKNYWFLRKKLSA